MVEVHGTHTVVSAMEEAQGLYITMHLQCIQMYGVHTETKPRIMAAHLKIYPSSCPVYDREIAVMLDIGIRSVYFS
jgi:hypothetical protein